MQKALVEPDVTARFEAFAFDTLTWSPQEIERQTQPKSTIYAGLVKRKSISLA